MPKGERPSHTTHLNGISLFRLFWTLIPINSFGRRYFQLALDFTSSNRKYNYYEQMTFRVHI